MSGPQPWRDGTAIVQIRTASAAVHWSGEEPIIDPEPWVQDALCAQVDPEMFFPEHGESAAPAKAICGVCDVVAECLEYALRTNQTDGVWGGKSRLERRDMPRKPAA